jgi:hypothetical protein
LPNVPTVDEQGYRGYEVDIWYGLVAPARTPKATIVQLTDWLTTAMKVPEIHQKLAVQGLNPEAALTACWNALGEAAPATAQVSVRLSFDRDGKVFGQPLITYANPATSEEGREAVRDAVARALKLCEPLPLSDTFRDVVAVHPIGVRLGNGWKRRVRSEL